MSMGDGQNWLRSILPSIQVGLVAETENKLIYSQSKHIHTYIEVSYISFLLSRWEDCQNA